MTKAVGYIRISTQGQVRWGEIMCYCVDNGIGLIRGYKGVGVRKSMKMA